MKQTAHVCGRCCERPASRVMLYPLFLYICNQCFFEYAKTLDEMEYKTLEDYERSLE